MVIVGETRWLETFKKIEKRGETERERKKDIVGGTNSREGASLEKEKRHKEKGEGTRKRRK